MSATLLHSLQVAAAVGQQAPRLALMVSSRNLPLAAVAQNQAPVVPGQNPGGAPVVPGQNPGGAPVIPGQNPGGTPVTPTPGAPGTTTTTGGEFPTILLTALVFSSAAAALLILFLPTRTADQRGRIRLVALVGAVVPMLFSLLGTNFQISQELLGGTVSFEERHHWIGGAVLGADYHLAVDGLSLPLLVVSTVVFTVAVVASWREQRRVKLYFVLLLLLETGVDGVLCSYDYLMLLLFWGMELLPVFLLVAVWGGPGRRRAARRQLAFAATTATLLLVAVLLVAVKAQQGSLDFDSVNTVALTTGIATAGFWLTFAAFALRLPMAPLHGWLTDVYAEAPPAVAAVVGGSLVLLGGYGMLRITLTAFPSAAHHFSLVLAGLAVLSAVWGALGALAEDDLRRLVAYLGVAQMAVVLLAVSAQSAIALNGAVVQLAAAGLIVAMLLLLSGAVEERTRTRSLARLGGLVWQLPRLGALWVLAAVAAVGVPLLAAFTGEFMVFTGAFPAHRFATVLVMATTVVTTACLLRALQRVLFGPARDAYARAKDASTLELFYLIPVAVMIAMFGVLPGRIMPMVNNGVQAIMARLSGA